MLVIMHSDLTKLQNECFCIVASVFNDFLKKYMINLVAHDMYLEKKNDKTSGTWNVF